MTMTTAKQIFDYLPGIWRLSRQTITPLKKWNNSGAESIKASGFAAIVPSQSNSNLLIYSEKVVVNNPDDSSSVMNGMEARQKYKYLFDSTSSTLTKYFFDDRLFYTLDIKSDSARDLKTTEATAISSIVGCGEHLCIQDMYVANYQFIDSRNFVLKYTINGPKKCYEIITEFEKLESDEVAQFDVRIENNEIV